MRKVGCDRRFADTPSPRMRVWRGERRKDDAELLRMTVWSVPFVVISASLVGGCGGGFPEPRTQMAESEGAVRSAELAGAQNSPQSALHLKRAREQIMSAKNLIQEGENERAEWVLRRAQADADLALSLATEETQRKKAAESKAELEQLQESIRQRGQK